MFWPLSTGFSLRYRREHRRAFTLIELLVVIVILGILMAVAVPTFLRQQAKAQDSRTQQYLTTAYKAIRASTPETANKYPASTSMVSWVRQSEPELTAQRGDCAAGVTNAPTDAVLVDTASSANALTLCSKSQSGNIWKLTATSTGAPTLADGTMVGLTLSSYEITDAVRSAAVQGDGRSADSSTGIWEGTTNLLPDGGSEINVSQWVTANGLGFVVRDNARAKFGGYSAFYTAPGTGSFSAGVYQMTGSGLNGAAGTVYTGSVWTSGAAGKNLELLLRFQFTDASFQDFTTPFTSSDSWSRVSTTATVPAGKTLDHVEVQVRPFNLVVDSSFGPWTIWVDGAQLEQKTLATPYVDTSSGTATRGSGRVQAPASLVSATQGWFATRVRMDWAKAAGTPGGVSNLAFSMWNSPSSQYYFLYYQSGGSFGMQLFNGSSYEGPLLGGVNWNAGDYLTIVGSWTSSTVNVSVNGVPFSGVARTITPTGLASTFDIGQWGGSSRWCDCDILWFATGEGTLSNSDAASIDGFGNSDPSRSAFPAAAQATMVWNGVGTNGSLK